MFCPKEYVSLEEFHQLCNWAAEDWMEEFRPAPKEGEIAADLHAIGTQMLTIWLMTTAFKQIDVMICSPEGTALRAAPLLLLHEDLLDRYNWQWPLPEGGALHKWLTEALAERNFFPLGDRFRFIDTLTSSIVASPDRTAELGRHGLEIDENVRLQCNIVSKFDGWSVSVDIAKDIETLERFYDLVALDPDVKDGDLDPDVLDRTGKIPGLTGQTLSDADIIKALIGEVDAGGLPVRDEAQVRYAPRMKHKCWHDLWSKASEQRDVLKRSGPKRGRKLGSGPITAE